MAEYSQYGSLVVLAEHRRMTQAQALQLEYQEAMLSFAYLQTSARYAKALQRAAKTTN